MSAAERHAKRLSDLDYCIHLAMGNPLMSPTKIALNNMKARAEKEFALEQIVERWPLARMVSTWR